LKEAATWTTSAEHVESWSYLKFPYYKKLGWPGGVYRVGPLGRLNAAERISTPLAAEELRYWKSINGGKPVEHTLYYHLRSPDRSAVRS
jgi:NAD-reducing hydrogenase large subunit